MAWVGRRFPLIAPPFAPVDLLLLYRAVKRDHIEAGSETTWIDYR